MKDLRKSSGALSLRAVLIDMGVTHPDFYNALSEIGFADFQIQHLRKEIADKVYKSSKFEIIYDYTP